MKFAPLSINPPVVLRLGNNGFTLVELLVVIAIIAILATVGFATFSGIQKNARDAARKADIDALAKAMEAKVIITTGQYQAIDSAFFTNGAIPADAAVSKYSFVSVAAVGGTLAAAPAGAWAATSPNPTGYATIASGAPAANYGWRFCARLEVDGTAYCRTNSQ